MSAEGLMDVQRRDAFLRESLWTGVGHFLFRCDALLRICRVCRGASYHSCQSLTHGGVNITALLTAASRRSVVRVLLTYRYLLTSAASLGLTFRNAEGHPGGC